MIKEWSDEAWEEFLEQVKKDKEFNLLVNFYSKNFKI